MTSDSEPDSTPTPTDDAPTANSGRRGAGDEEVVVLAETVAELLLDNVTELRPHVDSLLGDLAADLRGEPATVSRARLDAIEAAAGKLLAQVKVAQTLDGSGRDEGGGSA